MAATADEVMAAVSDLEAYPEWARGVSAVEVLDTFADGRPRQARFEVSSGPVKGSYTLEYVVRGDRRQGPVRTDGLDARRELAAEVPGGRVPGAAAR